MTTRPICVLISSRNMTWITRDKLQLLAESVISRQAAPLDDEFEWIYRDFRKIMSQAAASALFSDRRSFFITWNRIRSFLSDVEASLLTEWAEVPQQTSSTESVIQLGQSSTANSPNSSAVDSDGFSVGGSEDIQEICMRLDRKRRRVQSPSTMSYRETNERASEFNEDSLSEQPYDVINTRLIESTNILKNNSLFSQVNHPGDTCESSTRLYDPTIDIPVSQCDSRRIDLGDQPMPVELRVSAVVEPGFLTKQVVPEQSEAQVEGRFFAEGVVDALRASESSKAATWETLTISLASISKFISTDNMILRQEDDLGLPEGYLDLPKMLIADCKSDKSKNIFTGIIYRFLSVVYNFSLNGSSLLPSTFLDGVTFSDSGLVCNLETTLSDGDKKVFFCFPSWVYLALRRYDLSLGKRNKFLHGPKNGSAFMTQLRTAEKEPWSMVESEAFSTSRPSSLTRYESTKELARQTLLDIFTDYENYYKQKKFYHCWYLALCRPVSFAMAPPPPDKKS